MEGELGGGSCRSIRILGSEAMRLDLDEETRGTDALGGSLSTVAMVGARALGVGLLGIGLGTFTILGLGGGVSFDAVAVATAAVAFGTVMLRMTVVTLGASATRLGGGGAGGLGRANALSDEGLLDDGTTISTEKVWERTIGGGGDFVDWGVGVVLGKAFGIGSHIGRDGRWGRRSRSRRGR